MREAVGIRPLIDRVLIVEDRAARELCLNILRKRDHKTLIRSELISLGGHGDLTKACQAFPSKASAFQLVAIYDGDVRDEVNALKPTWPHAFLPGTEAIEVIFRGILEREVASVAAKLGRTENELAVALAKLVGLDPHDWFNELTRTLHVSYSELMHACYEQWVQDERVRAHIDNFVGDLKRALGS